MSEMVEPTVSSFDEIKAWLEAYEECVNDLNYSRARDLFSGMARCYGIRVPMAVTIDEFQSKEWEKEWPFIDKFKWKYTHRIIFESDPGSKWFASAFLDWTAVGFDHNGKPYARNGRTDLVFIKPGGAPAKCYHLHMSLNPGVRHDSFGLDGKPKEVQAFE